VCTFLISELFDVLSLSNCEAVHENIVNIVFINIFFSHLRVYVTIHKIRKNLESMKMAPKRSCIIKNDKDYMHAVKIINLGKIVVKQLDSLEFYEWNQLNKSISMNKFLM
jgi:hypothetical protein